MKRLIAVILLSAVCMTACSENEVSQSDSEIESVIATEETTTVESTAEETEPETSPYVIYKEILPPVNLELTENELHVINFNTGETVQTIEGDFKSKIENATVDAEYYRRPEEYITREDYDFDGYNDLFILTELKGINKSGVYYHYNTDTQLYEEWDTLNEIGYEMFAYTDGRLNSFVGTDTSHKYCNYVWNEDKLEVAYSSEIIKDDKNNYQQIVYKRDDEKGKITDRKFYFASDESKLYITDSIINGGEQCFDVDFAGIDLSVASSLSGRCNFRDYDFDGYDDLLIYDSGISDYTHLSAKYYRYNPDSRLFEEWDELNEFGMYLYTSDENKTVHTDVYYKQEKTREIIYYNWENGKLKPVSATEDFQDENNKNEYQRVYEYDENGERILIDTVLCYEYEEQATHEKYNIVTDDLGREYTVPVK